MATTGKSARQKGHNYEQVFCKMLRYFGWEAVTSRAESRNLDDKGVDIVDNTPFYFQLKAVERMNTSYHDLLQSMPMEKIRVVVHKKNNKGSVVVMMLEDFQEIHLNKGYQSKEMHP